MATMMMLALIVLSCILIAFGLSQARLLNGSLIGEAPIWLGVIVPIGIVAGLRQIPMAQRPVWGLIALGWLVGAGSRTLGLETTSIVSLIGFGVAALGYTAWRWHVIATTRRPLPRKTLWMVVALVLLTIAIFLWPLP